jgi:Insertion element 4 transposase N-terminal/Transposase DDE domain
MGGRIVSLSAALEALQEAIPGDISNFVSSLNPEWIDAALKSTGKPTVRRRKLPGEQVVWLVIGMAMFANWSIMAVVEHLSLVIGGTAVPSSVIEARYRIGSKPLKWLFERVARAWAHAEGESSHWRGLCLYGLDGSHLRVPDSEENFQHFGKPASGRSDAGYPQLRLVALMNLGTRLLAGAAMGPWAKGEVTLAQDMWPLIPDNSLTIVDRGFLSYLILFQIVAERGNRHFLCRAKKNTRYEIVKILPDGTALAFIDPSQALRKKEPGIPGPLEVRMIHYHRPDGTIGVLITSLIDYVAYPADELIILYHERWELEVALDELKTDMLERKEALRSKKHDGVYQEVWALLLTYNLVRREMQLTAQEMGVRANRISFKNSLIFIRNFFVAAQFVAPGSLPKHLGELRESMRILLLPERRSERRYPRHVKIKMSNYRRNPGRRQKARETA